MPDTASPYEQDWYAWTQDQAARLRAWPEQLRPNGLDVEHLAEEVEDMGGAQRRAIESYLRQIALHLLTIEFHSAAEARSHWKTEVDGFRDSLDLEFRDSPSLRARRQEFFEDAWRRAARDLGRQLDRDAPDRARAIAKLLVAEVPPRYDLDSQILTEGWYPEPFAG
jgi:hypothetical protein